VKKTVSLYQSICHFVRLEQAGLNWFFLAADRRRSMRAISEVYSVRPEASSNGKTVKHALVVVVVVVVEMSTI